MQPSNLTGRLYDKVAIVTGSSSGLGQEIALVYIQEGAKVVCVDIEQRDLKVKKEKGEERVMEVLADVSNAKEVVALIEKTVKRFGRIDIIVNSIGISPPPALIHETPEDTWDEIMTVNVRSVFLGCKYAIAQMLKQERRGSGDRGWIINIAPTSYPAFTGAVVAMNEQNAHDYAEQRIHCNVIRPGYTQTIDTQTAANVQAEAVFCASDELVAWVRPQNLDYLRSMDQSLHPGLPCQP